MKKQNIISDYLSENKNAEIDSQVNSEAKDIEKQHLIDLMNMKTIDEVADELYNLLIDQSNIPREHYENEIKGFLVEAILRQKQIDENLAVEFAEFVLSSKVEYIYNTQNGNVYLYDRQKHNIKQLFQLFKKEKGYL